jgi:HK97 family phage prohead protease
MEADFSGYATKANLKCTDGRTIMPDAFKDCDGNRVPLVWQHGHSDPSNVLGHAILENRVDGVYAYGFLNDTAGGLNAKKLVQHGDIRAMSIYANQLVERSKSVFHGVIREVSLVLSGANPGALIDNISFAHSDGQIETLEDEAIIYTGLELEHATKEADTLAPVPDPTVSANPVTNTDSSVPTEDNDPTVQEVYDSLTPMQRDVVNFMIGAALEEARSEASAEHSDENEDILTQEGTTMPRNVFELNNQVETPALTHDDMKGIVADAMKTGSLKAAVENFAHATTYGVENIDLLFPDAKSVMERPELITRRMAWVSTVLTGVRHSPFSRIKTLTADLTHDEARAKGYIKANMKKDEFFSLAKRVTTPTTIYKKQKLDRDDIIDITDFDVVAWIKAEMRIMLDEEIARAILFGDGRDIASDDKISETNLRPIAKENALYVHTLEFDPTAAGKSYSDLVDEVLLARPFYKGTGSPTFFTTEEVVTRILLTKDEMGRRIYRSVEDIAAEMRVANIVAVEAMESESDLIGVIVNLQDYTVGADKGGDISMFDDFDIDYNQYKYLMETRISGALTRVKSAIVVRKPAPVGP